MRAKKYSALVILFCSCMQYAFAGQPVIRDNAYMDIEGAGLRNSEEKEPLKGKIVTIHTVGGFINILSTSRFHALAGKYYYHAYFTENNRNEDLTSARISKLKVQGNIGQVYLQVNKELFIDILDRQTDTLVTRYAIKRNKLIPQIKFYRFAGNTSIPFDSASFTDHAELKINPGEKIVPGIIAGTDTKDLEIEYIVINLQTKKTEHKNRFEPLRLAANTEYQIRFNYVLQPETVTMGYIQVSAYWYQSFLTYLIFLIIMAALIFVLISTRFKNRIRSSEKEQQKMEEAAIRLQALLNPHFTFNALNSIQGLMNTDRIEEANQYLEEFSSLLRQTLAYSRHVFNNLDRELEMMRMYLSLEALRFNFFWHIEVAASLNTSIIEIPTLLLQPLIENSIKHGIKQLGGKGEIRIVCKEGEIKDSFVIVVKDNGTWIDKNTGQGYGLSLTEERIRTINKMKKDQTIVLSFNKESGTEAIFTFYNWINP